MYKWYQSLASISSPGCFLLRSLRLCGKSQVCGESQATGQQPETGCPNPCQAPGRAPGWMLANRLPESVPGTRCSARLDASKQVPKSVPGTRYGAGSDAGKKAAQIGARHPVLDKSSRLCGVRITALNCLSLLGFRKRKNNYFDNYSTFAGCSARGGGKLRVHSRKENLAARIAFYWFLFLERSFDEMPLFVSWALDKLASFECCSRCLGNGG